MAYEQPNPITVAPSTMFTSLAPPPRADFFSRSFVSDLPTRPSTNFDPPRISKRGLYKNPARTPNPGPPLPKKRALTKKLARTGPKEKLVSDADFKVKIIRNGVPVQKGRKGKGKSKSRKKRKYN